MASEAREVLDRLCHHHDGKIGYVVYRCVYGDDEEWFRFMERLTAYVHVSLDDDDDCKELKENLAWIVQEDVTSLDGASKAEVMRYVTRNKTSSCDSTDTLPQGNSRNGSLQLMEIRV